MASLLNTQIRSYTVACAIPVVQQVVGASALLKNLIGLVKDVAWAIFSCESFTAIRDRVELKQNSIRNDIQVLRGLQTINNNALQVLQAADIQHLRSGIPVDFGPSIQVLLDQQNQWNLKPLSSDLMRMIHSTYDASTPIGQYKILSCTVYMQIETKIAQLDSKCVNLDLWNCIPAVERLHNIAIAITSMTPVVGTIYNVVSLQYMKPVP